MTGKSKIEDVRTVAKAARLDRQRHHGNPTERGIDRVGTIGELSCRIWVEVGTVASSSGGPRWREGHWCRRRALSASSRPDRGPRLLAIREFPQIRRPQLGSTRELLYSLDLRDRVVAAIRPA
jgi:hypothetical protein